MFLVVFSVADPIQWCTRTACWPEWNRTFISTIANTWVYLTVSRQNSCCKKILSSNCCQERQLKTLPVCVISAIHGVFLIRVKPKDNPLLPTCQDTTSQPGLCTHKHAHEEHMVNGWKQVVVIGFKQRLTLIKYKSLANLQLVRGWRLVRWPWNDHQNWADVLQIWSNHFEVLNWY